MPRLRAASATLSPKVVLPVSMPPSSTTQPPVIRLSTISACDTTVISQAFLSRHEAFVLAVSPLPAARLTRLGPIGAEIGLGPALDCTATHARPVKSKMEAAEKRALSTTNLYDPKCGSIKELRMIVQVAELLSQWGAVWLR